LSKKTVFISDADSPSGKALINRFSEARMDFVLNSQLDDKEWTDQLVALQAAGTNAIITHTDLCSRSDLASMLDKAESQLGPIEVMIHNQMLSEPAAIETCNETSFLDIMQGNAKSAFFCTQQVGKRMSTRERGSIILVSSIHSEKPTGAAFSFSASQGAIKMLAHEASLFLGRHNVRVNLIEMGPVDGSDALFPSEVSGLYESYRYKVPSAVLGTNKDLAELAFFLAKDEPRYLNGADIRLDGGFLMHYLDNKMKKPAEEDR